MDYYSNIQCLGYPIFNGSLAEIELNEKIVINTINQYSYCIAEEDADFKDALLRSDILLPDGIGIVAASRFLNGDKIQKIAGADMHRFLLKKMNLEERSCFYLGSSKETLKLIEERVSKEYPNIRTGSYSPPFKTEFSDDDSDKMVDIINDFSPDVLFIGMTAPKQEKWSHKYKNKLDAKIICSIGAVFDFYAGTIERPSNFYINTGTEWLGRLIKEPKRMRERYLYYGAIYTYYLTLEKYKLLFPQKKQSEIIETEIIKTEK